VRSNAPQHRRLVMHRLPPHVHAGRPTFAWSLLLVTLVGCSAEQGNAEVCLASVHDALVGGTPDASSVELSASQVSPIGAVLNAGGEVHCTGSLVAPTFVLTARHCSAEELRFKSGDFEATVVRQIAHESRDALLLQLDVQGDAPKPLLGFAGELGADWVGREVTLVGFGRDENGDTGRRRYLVEPVVEVTAQHVSVRGSEDSGACHGDSGGPLLSRSTGSVGQTIGILSRGATDCRGVDRYERIDQLGQWLSSEMERAAAAGCGAVDEEGACSGATASWCEDGKLRAQTCVDKQLCGYATGVGYRCLDGEFDPCDGFGDMSSCRDDDIVRCDHGVLRSTSCGACGQHCALGPEGNARCE
jgi:hypothetical protein